MNNNKKKNETATTQEVQMKSCRVERAWKCKFHNVFFIATKMDLIDKKCTVHGVNF